MAKFTKLLDEKKINLVGIGDMRKEELVEVSKFLGLENIGDKSLEMLRKEIGHLGKLLLAGQVCIDQCNKGSNKKSQKVYKVNKCLCVCV